MTRDLAMTIQSPTRTFICLRLCHEFRSFVPHSFCVFGNLCFLMMMDAPFLPSHILRIQKKNQTHTEEDEREEGGKQAPRGTRTNADRAPL